MRNGQIEQIGTPEEVYYQPRTLFVAQFLGRTNLLMSEAQGTEADTPVGRVTLNRFAKGHVLLSLRPEHLTLEAASADAAVASGEVVRASGEVVGREFRGHDITFRVLLDGSEYLVHTPNRMAFQPGDRVLIRAIEPAVVLESRPSMSRLGETEDSPAV
jgi:iron(III) transport system ATP-binding protein